MNDIKIIARTIEEENVNPEILRKDLTLIAGKAAGICYMPDDYLSAGIQDEEKAIKRAAMNAKSGHYSVYEHGHITFIIKTSKMMAMILNSMGLYSTSEKSARYTMMTPDTNLEKELYNKWIDIYKDLIPKKYNDISLTDKEIEKLSIENARYLISVFTNTVLEYTIPFNRAILMCGWLDSLSKNIISKYNLEKASEYAPNGKTFNLLYKKIAEECIDFAGKLRSAIGITVDDHILDDHKALGIELFAELSYMYKVEDYKSIVNIDDISKILTKEERFGDSYTLNYKASFAELAQAQRHRTLHYSITDNFTRKTDFECYTPDIIKDTDYEKEWQLDFKKLISNNIIPQGTLLNICEQGRFEDFVVKCKERCCYRAQEEIRKITMESVQKFASISMFTNDLCYFNKALLNSIIDDNGAVTRCRFSGYTCKEPCKFVASKNN